VTDDPGKGRMERVGARGRKHEATAFLVIMIAFLAGEMTARAPLTAWGYVFSFCLAFLTGTIGRRLLVRRQNDA
jgi:hypothetical protein